jgi:hypothetical protein
LTKETNDCVMRYNKASFGLVLAAFVMAVIGTTQPLFGVKRPSPMYADVTLVQSTVSLWLECDTSLLQGVTSTNCTELKLTGEDTNVALGFPCPPLASRIQAGRAFSVMSDAVLGVLALLTFARMAVVFSDGHRIHAAVFALVILATVFLLLAFPIMISVYTGAFECGGKFVGDFQPSKIGGVAMGGIMVAVAWASCAGALIVEWISRSSIASEGDESYKNVA